MWRNYPIFVLSPEMTALLIIAIVWSVIWKGLALWKAARNFHKAWFVVMLVVNTLGVLEIIYLLTAGKKSSAHHDQH